MQKSKTIICCIAVVIVIGVLTVITFRDLYTFVTIKTEITSDEAAESFLDSSMEVVSSEKKDNYLFYFYCVNKNDSHAYLVTVSRQHSFSWQDEVNTTPLTNDDGTPMKGETLKANIDKIAVGDS